MRKRYIRPKQPVDIAYGEIKILVDEQKSQIRSHAQKEQELPVPVFPRLQQQSENIIYRYGKQQQYYVLPFAEGIKYKACAQQAYVLCKNVFSADDKIEKENCGKKTEKEDDTGKNHFTLPFRL